MNRSGEMCNLRGFEGRSGLLFFVLCVSSNKAASEKVKELRLLLEPTQILKVDVFSVQGGFFLLKV